jgi:hypothetical protein
VVVVFPFFIFYYEADDEGMSAEETAGGSMVAYCCNFKNVKRSLASAFCYTLVTCAISAFIVVMMYTYLAETDIPYTLTTVPVGSTAFMPSEFFSVVTIVGKW